MNQPSGSGYKYMGWKYFNQMSFLKEVQKSRPRIGNLPTCEGNYWLEIDREKQQLLRDIEMRKSEKNKSTNYCFLNSLIEPLNSLPLVAQLNIKEQFTAILHAALRENAQNTENLM
ncbi:uncharacterized protein LOC133390967 [Anopheles gambiae]|uniref:uncharacterized protein LOC133390967 n=1 Tax=Anopheles gambiae TaxID=7165 RepID=UPI002AC935C4|nr:uncharacterized protein LOC133390967 [Anopheles gambiae]